MNTRPEFGTAAHKNVAVLSIDPAFENRLVLESIFGHSNWALFHATGLDSAVPILREQEIGVVLCDGDGQPGLWKETLDNLRFLPNAPHLIVATRHADNSIWSDALGHGAYDVLAKPFDRRELIRGVSVAWLHWQYRREGSPEWSAAS